MANLKRDWKAEAKQSYNDYAKHVAERADAQAALKRDKENEQTIKEFFAKTFEDCRDDYKKEKFPWTYEEKDREYVSPHYGDPIPKDPYQSDKDQNAHYIYPKWYGGDPYNPPTEKFPVPDSDDWKRTKEKFGRQTVTQSEVQELLRQVEDLVRENNELRDVQTRNQELIRQVSRLNELLTKTTQALEEAATKLEHFEERERERNRRIPEPSETDDTITPKANRFKTISIPEDDAVTV